MAEAYPSSVMQDLLTFPLTDALFGRRSRRFLLGASIPDGPLAFTSTKEPEPLTEVEQMMVLTAAAGVTGWNYLIMHNPQYAPHIANYACSAGGRTFSSAAGFHTSQLFYTDDDGVYMLDTRDAPAMVERDENGQIDVDRLIDAHRTLIKQVADERLQLPRRPPFIEGHNLWCANMPGSTLIIPVADLAQHMLANLCYYLQNGAVIRDDIKNIPIEGLDDFGDIADLDNPYPLSFVEHTTLGECVAELTMACYSGMLMLQAMGLGGWLFNGLDPYAVLGASDDPEAPGLGFRYDTNDDWSLPNPTGLPGVFEGYCPPHYPDMRAAVDALVDRKFGSGGPFNPETPGYWKDTRSIRSSAEVHSERFKECVALMAQHIFDHYGKFPGTIPSIYVLPYMQAHHLDLEFYDTHFEPGAYLQTHAEHTAKWHG